jgi:hypothetical protein
MEDKKMKPKKNEEEEDWYDVTDRELDYGFDDREGK